MDNMDMDMDYMDMDNMNFDGMYMDMDNMDNMDMELDLDWNMLDNSTWANMTSENFTQECQANDWCEEECPEEYWNAGLTDCWARVKHDENGTLAGCRATTLSMIILLEDLW